MTIKEALVSRVPRIRKPTWQPAAYLRLPLLAVGAYGPWAELYDDRVQRDVLGVRPGSQRILMSGAHLDDEGYERYDGSVSESEQLAGNFAKTYSEA